jgi:bacillithiol system protein YtxJ
MRIQEEATPDWPGALKAAPIVVIYKHSPWCSVSFFSRQSLRGFARTHPAIPIFQVDVIAQRPLSDRIAKDLGIVHASPQAIMVADGRVIWTGSHTAVSAASLDSALSQTGWIPE